LVVDCEPGAVDAVAICQLVKDAIAAEQNEVMFGLDLKRLDVRDSDDHAGISSVFHQLCLDVAKGSGHRETAGQHSVWAK
jgi:hypothetical protein